jgi:hypothetical protein
MSKENKTRYRTKTNAQGKTVFDGSVPQDGKQVPTTAPASTLPNATPVNAVETPIVDPKVYEQFHSMTGEELDWQQYYEDYLFGIQDIWDNLNARVDPSQETLKYFEEKAYEIASNDFGKKVLRDDIATFETSPKKRAVIPLQVLTKVLAKRAEEFIRKHKPVYDLGEFEDRGQISGGYEELYCSVCEKCSYPCLKVQEARRDMPLHEANDLEGEMVNLAVKEGLEKWDSYNSEFSLIAVENELKRLGIIAFTANTGGGCATIYLGDPNAEGYYLTVGGPGSFEGAGNPVGYFEDFYIGPDEQTLPDAPSIYNGERTVEGIVAALADAFNRALG